MMPQEKKPPPGSCPKRLVRAKHLRNQIYIKKKQSEGLLDQALIILQHKWKLDEDIRKMLCEQEEITREYFYDNGLVKVGKTKTKEIDRVAKLEEETGYTVQEALALLSARRKE